MEHWDVIAAERRNLADQLDGLTPQQWATQSLCDAWTIRGVVAHLVMTHKVSIPRFMVAIALARGSFARANVTLTAREAQQPTTELIADLRKFADSHFKPPGFGSEAPLADILIHGQDIRIPLGLDTPGPIEPWRVALDFLVTPKAQRGFSARKLPALRLRATDLDWTHGSGEEVSGPAIALALAIMGRKARLRDLTGPGAPTFAGVTTGSVRSTD
jgi:uncharacterized protein (TIGR03083 family)